jgi:hypothetical protein
LAAPIIGRLTKYFWKIMAGTIAGAMIATARRRTGAAGGVCSCAAIAAATLAFAVSWSMLVPFCFGGKNGDAQRGRRRARCV